MSSEELKYVQGNTERQIEMPYTFTEGNAVREIAPVRKESEKTIRHNITVTNAETAKEVATSRVMNYVSMALLLIAIVTTIYVCYNYLQIQADIIQLEKEITSLERNIASVDKENAALESVINSQSLDLEYVYNTAVAKLGMVYPNNNEVIYYTSEGTSYYRDYSVVK